MRTLGSGQGHGSPGQPQQHRGGGGGRLHPRLLQRAPVAGGQVGVEQGADLDTVHSGKKRGGMRTKSVNDP